jgi:hypothetical protein
MAKFVTKSIYTLTDELTGEEVTQETEPTTFKIKLVGDATTYEKVMSKENEERFKTWLASEGSALTLAEKGQIEELERKIAELESENEKLGTNPEAKSTATGRKPRVSKPGTYRAVVEKHLGKTSYNDVKEAARAEGVTVKDGAGAPSARAWQAYAEKHLTAEQLKDVEQKVTQ